VFSLLRVVTRVIPAGRIRAAGSGDSERENTCNRHVITRFRGGRIHLTLISVNVDSVGAIELCSEENIDVECFGN
jgi:hypothetical protein